jgi:hypothetical protein
MNEERGQRMRLYRLWRTATILCALGAVEIGVLAWQRQQRGSRWPACRSQRWPRMPGDGVSPFAGPCSNMCM